MSTDFVFQTAKELKVGKYVLIDNIPCRIVDIETSKPGKHGSAKMRITAIGLFDGSKRNLLTPSDADVQVPIVERKTAQVISVDNDSAKLMDSETYEYFDVSIPEDLKGKVEAGKEVEILVSMGKRAIERVR
ncbi:MAG: translation initiation factor IF-5A [Candidatus Micrarchaeota archaeon]|nr:translation initiation factor IF-5A [Candidatus Micrarchaeota archaeon]